MTTITPGVDSSDTGLSWSMYNDQTQDVVVTFDLVPQRMAEQGCDQVFKVQTWAEQGHGKTWSDVAWNFWQGKQGQSGVKMAPNIILENLEEGWYSVGLKGEWNDANTPEADLNVHVYSSVSPVGLYNGD